MYFNNKKKINLSKQKSKYQKFELGTVTQSYLHSLVLIWMSNLKNIDLELIQVDWETFQSWVSDKQTDYNLNPEQNHNINMKLWR